MHAYDFNDKPAEGFDVADYRITLAPLRFRSRSANAFFEIKPNISVDRLLVTKKKKNNNNNGNWDAQQPK